MTRDGGRGRGILSPVLLLSLVLLALWMVALALTRVRAAADARGWSAGLLALTLAAASASCAAPVVALVEGFSVVAEAPPAEKAAVLAGRIDAARSAMFLSLLALPVLAIGLRAWRDHRRRRKEREQARAVVDAF